MDVKTPNSVYRFALCEFGEQLKKAVISDWEIEKTAVFQECEYR